MAFREGSVSSLLRTPRLVQAKRALVADMDTNSSDRTQHRAHDASAAAGLDITKKIIECVASHVTA